MYNNMKYLNRDISFLSFNQRVSDETKKNIPLGDKAMFHGITMSNLNEFLMVRYPDACHYEQPQHITELTEAIHAHYGLLSDRFIKFNKKYKLIRSIDSLKKDELQWVEEYFKDRLYPALQTISFDRTKTLNLHAGFYVLVTYESDGDDQSGYIEIPKTLSRFIQVKDQPYVVPIEDIIRKYIKKLFIHTHNCAVTPFSIARSAEVYINLDHYTDPFTMIQQTLKEREKSWITYMEVGNQNPKAVKVLRKVLPLASNTLILQSKFVHLMDLKSIPKSIYRVEDQCRKWEPVVTISPTVSMFDYIKQKDRLLFHPYESYDGSMVRFLEEAAADPNVVSIKIALYRVSDHSRIIDALLKAADTGKLVTVLIELKARFDEHHNIEISNILREGGVRIVFTKPDIKTHAKVCLITRKEKNGLRIYAHVGTGNYSETNSKLYTDYSYFSANQELGKDLTRFFTLLTSNQGTFKSNHLIYAPYNMREELEHQIEKQVKLAKNGKKSRIIAKCNSLTDEKIADRLIDAAKNGVSITLIIRGACVIQPQKNIKIYSIVGQFLEHSRLYIFGYGRKASYYIGSSDLMYRSFNRRFELLLNVKEPELKQRLSNHVQMYLKDNTNRRAILPNYQYENVKVKKGEKSFSVQNALKREARDLKNDNA